MSIDGFLTFLGFLAAAITVLKPLRRRRIALHATRHYIFSAVMAGIILVLFFFELLYSHLPGVLRKYLAWVGIKDSSFHIGPNRVAFLVLLAWIAGTLIIVRTARPNAAALG